MLYLFLVLNSIEEVMQKALIVHSISSPSKINNYKLKAILSSVITAILASLIEYVLPQSYIMGRLLYILLYTGYIFIITGSGLISAIIYYAISFVILNIIQYPIVFLFSKFVSDISNPKIGVWGNLITLIIIIILSRITEKKELSQLLNLDKTPIRLALANIYVFFLYDDFIFKTNINEYKSNISIYISCAITVILMNYLIIYEEKRIIERDNMIKVYRQNTVLYDELLSSLSSRQHDYDNKIATIRAMPNVTNDYESLVNSLESYLGQLYDESIDLSILKINKKQLAAYLFYASNKAKSENKKLKIRIDTPNIITTIPESDLIDILSILTDNMLEAIPPGDSCTLSIINTNNRLKIMTKNQGPVLTKEIMEKIFTKGYSTKSEMSSTNSSRGYGLYNLRKIVKHYKGNFSVHNEYSNDRKITYIVFNIEV